MKNSLRRPGDDPVLGLGTRGDAPGHAELPARRSPPSPPGPGWVPPPFHTHRSPAPAAPAETLLRSPVTRTSGA